MKTYLTFLYHFMANQGGLNMVTFFLSYSTHISMNFRSITNIFTLDSDLIWQINSYLFKIKQHVI